jgi:hypothetical protein
VKSAGVSGCPTFMTVMCSIGGVEAEMICYEGDDWSAELPTLYLLHFMIVHLLH